MEEKASILVVDDNVGLYEIMSFVLGHNGYAVTTVKNGPEAIEKVKKRPFDLIFVDIKIPPVDGMKTYKKIRKIRPETMVVMMTAYADAYVVGNLVQEALRGGAYGIIYKPLDIEKVTSLIERARETKNIVEK